MKTILLAAGQSSRMHPLEDKNQLSFVGKPLLEHLLERAKGAGSDDFVLVASEGNRDFVQAVCPGAKVVIQPDNDPGMAGGIRAALGEVEDDEALLILNGNDLVGPGAIEEVVKVGKTSDGALLGQICETYFPGGYLEVDKDNKIASIIEKPGEGNEPSKLVNIVVHYFSRSGDLKNALSKAESQADDVYEVALDALFKSKNFRAVPYGGVWQAVKYPWHVLDMASVFLSHQETSISEEAEISQSATIKGERVVIEAGVKIFENAVICGPCFIGKNTVVGNGVLIRHSHIGSDCLIGYNTEVARSWLSDNVTTHIAYVGDSVVDSGVNLGAYSCTANLRLDQKNIGVKVKEDKVCSGRNKLGSIIGKDVQIGVGARLMPGSKVEKNTHMRPNEVWY